MIISSSKYCTNFYQPRTSLKNTRHLDKITSQRYKISPEKIAKSLMKNRIYHVQKELTRLNDDSDLVNILVRAHCLYFYHSPYSEPKFSFRCQDSAFAIIQRNLFNQKLFRKIESLERLEIELGDEEEGVFLVDMPGRHFVNNSNETSYFQGHSFIIVKIIQENNASFLIAQSFVEEYSLKDFILKNKMIYDSYEKLFLEVLIPLKIILKKSGSWSKKECLAHFYLTGILPKELIDFSPPNINLLANATFGRSSNYRLEEDRAGSLGSVVNGELVIPEEWKKMFRG